MIDVAYRLGYLIDEDYYEEINEPDDIGRMIAGLSRTVKKKIR